MHDASGLFWVSFMVKAFWGTSDGIAGDGGAKGLRFFLPFYFFTFLPLIPQHYSLTLFISA